jgi:hypothetical protein
VTQVLFLLYLAIILGYILLSTAIIVLLVKIARKLGAQSTTRRVVAAVGVFTFFIAPMLDFVPGLLEFKRLCETEAGVRIYRVADQVEGFVNDDFTSERAAKELLLLGYHVIEGTHYKDSKGYRYTLNPDGTVNAQPIKEFTSRYRWVKPPREHLPWEITKNEHALVDQHTQERLAEFKQFYYDGNVALKTIQLNSHSPCRQGEHPLLYKDFLLKTLKPPTHLPGSGGTEKK